MANTFNQKNKRWLLLPFFGILLYILLYVAATFFYPGGNQVDENFKGFSWAQNYWCNLLNVNAINGQHNSARPVAIAAMAILGSSLAGFWCIFPRVAGLNKTAGTIIQVSGFIAMALLIFLSTAHHDIIINTATLAGLIAIAGTFAGLQKLKWKKLFWFGIGNVLLIAINNIFYYDEKLIVYLPIIQKITFLLFLIWFCLVDINLYKRESGKG
ncbi:MAG: hypothetical protein M3015_04520 [Bacteroidota bacterium]|nr:hypothetical protein [Bacteroidota bacterium]